VPTDLYLVNTNGGGLMRVTTGAAVDTAAWSSDGKKLVFSATAPGYGLELYTVNSDGSGLMGIPAARGGQAEPAWSPDGSQIVYTLDYQTLHIINVDGSAAHYLTDGEAASWSPDGRSIVFVRRLPHDLYGDIYVIGADGQGERRLTQGFHADRPVWSPDGQRIAFYGYLTNWSGGGVYVMNADGSGLGQVSKRLGVPSWLPDGQHIVQGLYNTIYMIDTGNGTVKTLLTPSSLDATYFAWQPGGD